MALTGVPPAFMREGNPSDPRAVRTRRLIIEAYERQLIQGFDVDTVAALVRAAGVSRSSFYCHFKSVEEVGVAALRELLDSFGSASHQSTGAVSSRLAATESSGSASLQEFVEHLNAHRTLCAAVLAAGPDNPAHSELQSTLVEHITIALSDVQGPMPDIGPRQVATFIVGGVMALVVSGLKYGDQTPAQVARAVHTMLPDWARDAEQLRTPLRTSPTSDESPRQARRL